jgi:hypothetical protein
MKGLLHVCTHHIPPVNTQAYKALRLLSNNNECTTYELYLELGSDPRSALQALKRQTYGYWLIHNIGRKKGVYKLDPRHLNGSQDSDKEARLERYKEWADRSKVQSERETLRYQSALLIQSEAKAAYQQYFNFQEDERPAKAQ